MHLHLLPQVTCISGLCLSVSDLRWGCCLYLGKISLSNKGPEMD